MAAGAPGARQFPRLGDSIGSDTGALLDCASVQLRCAIESIVQLRSNQSREYPWDTSSNASSITTRRIHVCTKAHSRCKRCAMDMPGH